MVLGLILGGYLGSKDVAPITENEIESLKWAQLECALNLADMALPCTPLPW